ncbi:hypothetical protein [Acetobacterium wieringae]|uniref:hypothetical protein n=1 Tax=Acetobacterium wieringae TaxID=52694 RepID=UPI002B1F30A9|nr:hypothetical protein [Acetobacterium wieringae]
MLEGRPTVAKDLLVVTVVPDKSDIDQYGAYLYHALIVIFSKQWHFQNPAPVWWSDS